MTYDPTGHLLLTPVDKDAPARVQRLRELGLGERPEPAFDEFAHRLADVTGAPFSMVNFIDENQQFFARAAHRDEVSRAGSGSYQIHFSQRRHTFLCNDYSSMRIIPAATVWWVTSSIRMKAPVARMSA